MDSLWELAEEQGALSVITGWHSTGITNKAGDVLRDIWHTTSEAQMSYGEALAS
jgi:hypothetical protein